MAREGILKRFRRRRAIPLTGVQKLALALVLVGVISALGIVGLLAFRQSQIKFYMDVPATITELDEHCDVTGKLQAGTGETITSMDCDAAGNLLSNNSGQAFKVVRAGTVTLSYQASGLEQKVKLPTSAFDPEKLAPGGKVMIYVNPNRLNDVKTDITWGDLVRSLLFMTGSIVLALLGLILYRMAAPVPVQRKSRRQARRAPSLGDGDEDEDNDDDLYEDDEAEEGEPPLRAFDEDEDIFEPMPPRPPPRKRVGM